MLSILNGVPNGTYPEQVKYLENAAIVLAASRLANGEYERLVENLRPLYLPQDLRKFKASVRSMRGAGKKPQQPPKTKKRAATTSQSAIIDEYASRGPAPGYGMTTMFARSDFWRYSAGVWRRHPPELIQFELDDILRDIEISTGKTYTMRTITSLQNMLRYDLYIDSDHLDSIPNLINLENGVYDTETGQLVKHDPRQRITTQLPFEFKPAAQCPKWLKFLESTLVYRLGDDWATDLELVDFIQEVFGYSLTTDISFQVMFFLIGQGANGKGVMFHILTKLAGDAALPIDLGALKGNNTYQLALAAGKRILHCSEVEAKNAMVSDGVIKALVAGDPLMVRQIREKPFEMRSVAKLWWSMNRLPDIVDTSHGFWRRVRVIPFNRVFSPAEMNVNLKEELEGELPGIFNWAMEGLKRLKENGAFTDTIQVEHWTKNYQAESNAVAMFIADECDRNPLDSIKIMKLYTRYKEWAVLNGFRVMNTKIFKRELENLGFEKKYPNRRGSAWLGLTLKPKAVWP